jgi:hypothetical protein
MKKNYLVFLLLFFFFNCFSQENKNALVWFDNIVGQKNLDINAGIKYSKKYVTIKGNHNFLFEDIFYKGTVTYDNQLYTNISLKYDLFEDNLISLATNTFNELSVILKKDKISSFIINNQKFINLKEYGFHKELYNSKKTLLYKKHAKERSEKQINNYVYSKFKLTSNYFIHYNNKRVLLKKKKDWIKLFPKKKSLINNFYKVNKTKLKSNSDAFLVDLIKRIED